METAMVGGTVVVVVVVCGLLLLLLLLLAAAVRRKIAKNKAPPPPAAPSKEEVTCPITLAQFVDPVVADDGYTYEREAIARWLATHDTSPQTREPMGKDLVPNQTLRAQINDGRAKAGLPPLPPTQHERPPPEQPSQPQPQAQAQAQTQEGQQRTVVRMSADQEVNQAIGTILASCPELRSLLPNLEAPQLRQLEETARSRPHLQHCATPLRRVLRRRQQGARDAAALPERVVAALRSDDPSPLVREDAALLCDGDATLHLAVWLQAHRCVERLLAIGPQRPATIDGAFPIHVAAARGAATVVARLLAAGADPNERAVGTPHPTQQQQQHRRPLCVGGARPLHMASSGGVVDVLARAGAPIDARDEHGSTPLHCATARGRVDAARALIAAGADVKAADFVEAQTALHRLAAHDRAQELVDALVAAGADVACETKLLGDAPLHIAAFRGNNSMVAALLRANAAQTPRKADGLTPCHLAASQGKHAAMELLLRASPDCANKDETVLHVAVRRKDLVGVEVVLAANAALVDAKRARDNSTPLHLAAALNFREGALALLNAGARVDARAVDSDQPIHVATWHNALDVADVLLARSADPNAARDKDRATPLHLASIRGLYAMASKLLDKGADRDAATLDGATPRDRAAQYQDQQMLDLLAPTTTATTTAT
ncbi:hypothetical protein CTAYLR_002150 [Chrysophaeum taylorii]|uniref:U-box domain-containing protein n=1 Tax=Chrysophaeum taylorii TaxID=2483200 RepID=A0AAD7UN52_9STRA|nr:hypothetical protein CTAYLR_002150 [Chrysophaeum taylorii]